MTLVTNLIKHIWVEQLYVTSLWVAPLGMTHLGNWGDPLWVTSLGSKLGVCLQRVNLIFFTLKEAVKKNPCWTRSKLSLNPLFSFEFALGFLVIISKAVCLIYWCPKNKFGLDPTPPPQFGQRPMFYFYFDDFPNGSLKKIGFFQTRVGVSRPGLEPYSVFLLIWGQNNV